MFEDNWFLFLLIVMLAFSADGNFTQRELTVMLSILFALTLTEFPSSSEDNNNCFCNKNI